jgi:hypothetical protein
MAQLNSLWWVSLTFFGCPVTSETGKQEEKTNQTKKRVNN